MGERLPRAVLDSDVIFSRVLHELFGRVAAEARLLDLIWSEPLFAEAERVLIERKPLPPGVAARWVGYLRQALPRRRSRHQPARPGDQPTYVDLYIAAFAPDRRPSPN